MDYTLSYDGSTLLEVDENVEHLVLPEDYYKSDSNNKDDKIKYLDGCIFLSINSPNEQLIL